MLQNVFVVMNNLVIIIIIIIDIAQFPSKCSIALYRSSNDNENNSKYISIYK